MRSKVAGNVAKYIITALISLAVIAYIVYHLVISFGTSVETAPAQLVTVNETITVDAYLLRDETVLTSTNTGGVNCLFQDGTMVRKNAEVANVFSGTDTSLIKTRIAEIDDQLKILTDSGMAENAAMTDASSISASLDELYYGIMEKVNQNSIDYAFRRKNEMLTLMNKRSVAQRLVSDYSVQIADLQTQRAQLTATLTNISETVRTPVSGYFYSELDGYENTFSSKICDTVTVDSFRKLIEAEPTDFGSNVVGKIATDYKWYVACILGAEEARAFAENKNYTVIFPYSADTEVEMSLYRSIADEKTGDTLLLFSAGYVDANFNFLRRQSVDIVEASYTGYRVPVSAVRIVDGKEGVYILNGNVVEFREIDPLVEIDGNLIVRERDTLGDADASNKLGFYDKIITKGKNLHAGQVVG